VKYLFDTDCIIDGLNGLQDAIVLIRTLGREGGAVSVISLAEIYDGIYAGADPAQDLVVARRFLAGFKVLDVTRPIVARFAQERANLRRRGTPLADFDLLIAATALTYDLTFVTRNIRHFERIGSLKLHRGDEQQASGQV
jgi:tRNA(fMet)-specific endonuclease VapC